MGGAHYAIEALSATASKTVVKKSTGCAPAPETRANYPQVSDVSSGKRLTAPSTHWAT